MKNLTGSPKSISWILFCLFGLLSSPSFGEFQILSKFKLEKCEKRTEPHDLNCTTKIVLNLAVPSESGGRDVSIVVEAVQVEEGTKSYMRTLRAPPVLTINKSDSFAVYDLVYMDDVPYKPEEYVVQTRRCEADAGANVVGICERLRDEDGHIMENTQPTCCPCGPRRRVPSSCGGIDHIWKGKRNTAHCVRFPGERFHVFSIGQRSVEYSIRIEVNTSSKVSEVIVSPENRTVTFDGNFLKVNLIGDYDGYTNIPSFEDMFLVIPKQGGPGQLQDLSGQPQDLGRNFSMWMLIERVRFGKECDKIGVSYEAFNKQPNFCSSENWSCLHNQLWNYWEEDRNRISNNLTPLYRVEGRFERINQHPNSGPLSLSIGITEVLNTNLLIELRADDIEYVYQRSPGKIISVTIPTFVALEQIGVATITTNNTGEDEASYSLTFHCSRGVTLMEEQYFILKPKESSVRSFKIYLTTDQAAKYTCSAILKDSDFSEVDRAECQFSAMAAYTDIGNGTEPTVKPPEGGINGILDSIDSTGKMFWEVLVDFITGETCRKKCSSLFDFSCHIQYICLSWIVMFSLILAIFPTVLVLLWLLHQKGLFDPFYDWWEDNCMSEDQRSRRHNIDPDYHRTRVKKHHKQAGRHHKHDVRYRQSGIYGDQKHKHSDRDTDYHYSRHHVYKNKHKHGHRKSSIIMQQVYLDGKEDDHIVHHRCRKETVYGRTI